MRLTRGSHSVKWTSFFKGFGPCSFFRWPVARMGQGSRVHAAADMSTGERRT